MGAPHMGPYGAAGGNAFIAAVLDFPLLDSVCERFAHGLDGRLGKVAVAFWVGACDFALSSFSPGWTIRTRSGSPLRYSNMVKVRPASSLRHTFSASPTGAP